MSDKELISLHNKGRYEQVFNELVKNYSQRLYWHLRYYTASHEDADDLLQEVFIKVWQTLPNFRGGSSFYTWLYRITTNEAISWLRKQKVRAAIQFDKLDRELQKAIATLSGVQKQVFLLRYYEEMPYEEISAILGSSVGSLKVSYHNAYNKIKEILQKKF